MIKTFVITTLKELILNIKIFEYFVKFPNKFDFLKILKNFIQSKDKLIIFGEYTYHVCKYILEPFLIFQISNNSTKNTLIHSNKKSFSLYLLMHKQIKFIIIIKHSFTF